MKKKEELTFKDLISIFIPKLWLIAIVAVLSVAVVAIYISAFKDDTYTSYSTIYVHKDDQIAGSSDISVAQDMGETYKYILQTEYFLSSVVIELKETNPEYDLTTGQLRSMISFTQDGETPIYRISVTSTDAKLAYTVSDCVEKIAPDVIMACIPNAFSITPIDSSVFPKAANTKNLVRNSLIAGVIGFVLAAAVIWVISMFDVVIRDKKRIEDNFDYLVLGIIPHHENVKEEKEV